MTVVRMPRFLARRIAWLPVAATFAALAGGLLAAGCGASPVTTTPPETATPAALVSAAVPGQPLPVPWAASPSRRDDAVPAPGTSALAALVMDEGSGAILYAKEPDRELPPASLTKIATAILVAESGRYEDVVRVDVDSRTMRGSTVMGLIPGDEFTLRDLTYGLMLPSGNDAALAIGRHLAGSDAAFVAEMNRLATRLGLQHTHFENPHGLGGTSHYTSAYDLAILSRYMMSFPEIRQIVATPFHRATGSRVIEMGTLNGLMWVRGVDGVKTGYTRTAGRTYALSAERDGHRVYVILLNAPNREGDGLALLEWAFANHRWSEPTAAALP